MIRPDLDIQRLENNYTGLCNSSHCYDKTVAKSKWKMKVS